MPIEIKDQSNRIAAIAILETVVARHDAAIRTSELCLQQQRDKQVHRLAELRHQKMLLAWHRDAARKAAAASNPPLQ